MAARRKGRRQQGPVSRAGAPLAVLPAHSVVCEARDAPVTQPCLTAVRKMVTSSFEAPLCHEAGPNPCRSNTGRSLPRCPSRPSGLPQASPVKENSFIRGPSCGLTDLSAQLPRLGSIAKGPASASNKFSVPLPPGLRLIPSLCLLL